VADDESKPGSGMPNPFNDFIAQLRTMADRMSTPAAFGQGLPAMPSLPGFTPPKMLPPPGALSASQLAAMSATVAAQRSGIEALQAQLQAFDEQLAVMEQILGPLTEWSRTWADLERTMMPPGAAG
jgi:hypothetical protein